MLYFFQEINFLENFSFAKIILHVIFFNGFDSYLLTSKFMNTKRNFTESSFSN
jgi:hypothetical protein